MQFIKQGTECPSSQLSKSTPKKMVGEAVKMYEMCQTECSAAQKIGLGKRLESKKKICFLPGLGKGEGAR